MAPIVTLRVRAMARTARTAAMARMARISTYSSSPSRRNWLEENCGDVPAAARPQDPLVSEMLRGGHALQTAGAALLDATLQSAARGPATAASATHTQTLEALKRVEDEGVARVVRAVETDGFRFRPSATVSLAQCSSFALGTALSVFGEKVSTSYLTGVKSAIADYYNDQIREIYAEKPEESQLKEMFKVARDDELVFVDEHTPDALDPAKYDEDPVRSFARNSTKVLLQIATRV